MYTKLHLFAAIVIAIFCIAKCDKKPSECEVNKCLNGATCKPLTSGDLCLCARFYWGKLCERRKEYPIDLTFVIGHSANRNLTQWQFILEYVNRIISNVRIGPSAIQVALITYSTESRVAWKLDSYHDVASLKQALSQLQDTPGSIDIAGALSLLHTEIYTPQGGHRPDERDVVTFLIDGVGKNQQRIVEEAEACHLAGIEMYVTAIGKRAQANMKQLKVIARSSPGAYLRMLDRYDQLPARGDAVATSINRLDNN